MRSRRHHWRNRKHYNENRTGTVLAGLFLLLVGVAAILRQTIFDFPSWVLSWPMILIAVGIFIGLKHGFRGPGWIILIGLGCIFLADKVVPGADLKPFIWPFVIISIGLFMIFGASSRKKWMREKWGWDGNDFAKNPDLSQGEAAPGDASYNVKDEDDFIDSTAILGSSKKVILSKNFKGGDITNFMGGAEINCSQAEITGRVKLDITQIFGGTKLIVPAHWTIKSTVTSIFGGFEDKRSPSGISPDPGKVLVLDGTTIFGGIEIKSY
jgi:predicted membrane protein